MTRIGFEIVVTTEVFTYTNPDTGVEEFFNVTAVQQELPRLLALGQAEVVETLLTDDHVDMIRRCRGVEQERLDAIPKDRLDVPVIAFITGPDSALSIDGHHRMVKRHELGMKTVRMVLIQENLRRQFSLSRAEVDEMTAIPTFGGRHG